MPATLPSDAATPPAPAPAEPGTMSAPAPAADSAPKPASRPRARKPAAARPAAAPKPVKAASKTAVKARAKSDGKPAAKPAATSAVQQDAPAQLVKAVKGAKPAKPAAPAPRKAAAPASRKVSVPAVETPPQAPAVTAKPAKLKEKLVRDSFTMPRSDFALVQRLKDRALGFRHPVKKSELLRAGLHALMALDNDALQAALTALPQLKTGRPRKAD